MLVRGPSHGIGVSSPGGEMDGRMPAVEVFSERRTTVKKLAALVVGIGLALPAPMLLVGCEDAGEAPVQENGGETDKGPEAPTTPPGEPE